MSAQPRTTTLGEAQAFGTAEYAREMRQRFDSHYAVCRVRHYADCARCEAMAIEADRAASAARRAERGGR